MSPSSSETIAVVGLGYVGRPLALALADHFKVIGYDPVAAKVEGVAHFTTDPSALAEATFYIVAVPTPIDEAGVPSLRDLENATRTIGAVLKPGDIVVYESTVYPGVTELVCLPLLEEVSNLCGKEGRDRNDFQVAYSPERINPGDTLRSLRSVTKIVSARNPDALDRVVRVYETVVDSLYRASSIRVAEAAKVLENTQRDLNIALMNEMSLVFNRDDIDTHAVIQAAATKWNFHDYRPGLVGGHCIGVDPYYLAYYAEQLGHHPEVILAGRRVNDSMGKHVAQQLIKALARAGKRISKTKIGILGLAFKANVDDTRNSRTHDIIVELHDHYIHTVIYDPLVPACDDFTALHGLDAIVVTVMHDEFQRLSVQQLRSMCVDEAILFDVRAGYDQYAAEAAGFTYWRL